MRAPGHPGCWGGTAGLLQSLLGHWMTLEVLFLPVSLPTLKAVRAMSQSLCCS